jgi:transcriptional regulator of nitric oxide reductase
MKNTVLLLGAVLLSTFTLRATANDALLSPRAQDSQVKAVSSATVTPTVMVSYVTPAAALRSPRATESQTKVVAGVSGDTYSTLACRKSMTASPKAVAECSSHTTMPGCAKLTSMN